MSPPSLDPTALGGSQRIIVWPGLLPRGENSLEFFEGKTTGEVNLPYYFFGSPGSICGHSYCKTNALQYACEKYNVLLKNCIVVGDSIDDRCIVGHAGKGVAFCTNDELLEKMAARSIKEKSFESLLAMAS